MKVQGYWGVQGLLNVSVPLRGVRDERHQDLRSQVPTTVSVPLRGVRDESNAEATEDLRASAGKGFRPLAGSKR
jgi:hypothetical protein